MVGHTPRVLVLATAGPERVQRTVVALRAARADTEVTVGVADANRWSYAGAGVEILTLGENTLDLDQTTVLAAVSERAFDLVVLPVGVPRPGFGALPRFVLAIRPTRVRVEGWPGLRLGSRWATWLYLAGLVLLLHWPLRVLLGAARALDGLGLLTLQALAGVWRPAVEGGGPSCHVILSLGTGGAQRQVQAYVRHEAARGRPVRLLLLTAQGDAPGADLDGPAVPVETVYDRFRSSRWRHLLAYCFPQSALVLALTGVLRELRPSCVWSWLFLANVVAAPAARLAGVPRVLTSVRNLSAWKVWPEYRRWWYRLADRRAAHLSDLVVVNAQTLVADYAAWAGVRPEKLHVIPNGIDSERFLAAPWRDLRARLGIPPGLPVVLTVGRLAHEKCQDVLIRCAARLRAWGVEHRLVIVGHGELEATLRRLACELGVVDIVVFAGKTTEPQSFYRSADVFALSSRIEGMPNVLMEAQLFGLPAVTTRSGGSAEVVAEGETGFVVEVGDEEGFAAALRRLLDDRELRRRMGEAAAHRMVSELGLDRTVAAMDALAREGLPERTP
ncbi:MAG: glycosyltransferase [Thermoanaerobaculaceae bacterium]|nr:glycosyltransferase [Thermoanaerobaculaceae bacterium]